MNLLNWLPFPKPSPYGLNDKRTVTIIIRRDGNDERMHKMEIIKTLSELKSISPRTTCDLNFLSIGWNTTKT